MIEVRLLLMNSPHPADEVLESWIWHWLTVFLFSTACQATLN